MQIGLENYNGFSGLYVVFEDNVSLWWLRFLKPGFRHCYLLFMTEDQQKLLKINPMSNQISIQLLTVGGVMEVIHNLEMSPLKTVCRVHIQPAPLKCAPIMAFTCVEMVKRTLGIHDFKIITPYQLYKKIKNCGK